MITLSRPSIGDDEKQAVLRVLDSGVLAQGPEVAAFETEFGDHVGGRHCVAVNSGTSALHIGMLAAGIGPGDEVIVPSFTFAASANSVVLCGATPVFVDIDIDTYCLDPEAVRAALGPRTAAIMAVHLYGHPADMNAIGEIAERHGLLVVEDAAQAHLASLDGRPVGALGDVAAFSFYPTKNMTTGEGGMVVARSEEIARKARLLRNQGMERRYYNEIAGFNVRMTDIAAAIGRVQLRKLPAWTERRQQIASRLTAGVQTVIPPATAQGAVHVFHQYTVRSENREALVGRLTEAGIESAVYYPVPVHRLPSFASEVELPVTERAAREVLSLPVHPALSDDDVVAVVSAVNG